MTTATTDTSAHAGGYTVDEVADLTSTTVRTIRWYQSEGLLPPPRRSGRVALYDGDHVSRLESIRDLQAHGLTLTAIRRLLDRAPGSAAATALAFVRTAVAQSVDPGGDVVSADELARRLGLPSGESADQALIEDLGIAARRPDGNWQLVAPAAFDASAELSRLGVPMEHRIRLTRVFQEHTNAMAGAVVDLFLEYVWPGPEAEDDPDQWAKLAETVERLRPLAAASVASVFDIALSRQAERAAEQMLAPVDAGDGDELEPPAASSR